MLCSYKIHGTYHTITNTKVWKIEFNDWNFFHYLFLVAISVTSIFSDLFSVHFITSIILEVLPNMNFVSFKIKISCF